jgi:hypothetical protein
MKRLGSPGLYIKAPTTTTTSKSKLKSVKTSQTKNNYLEAPSTQ